jgi:hypothetical protein
MSTEKVYGQDLGLVRVSDLLAELSSARSARSGGPPYPGAIGQDDGNGQEVWSQVNGYYMAFEDGSFQLTESGDVLITEG